MKPDTAPKISEIRKKFCPEWEIEDGREYIWIRNRATGQLEMSSYATGEKKYHHIVSSKKVSQSYVLRNLSDHTLRAIAVVNECADGAIDADGWSVSLIDVQTEFGLRLTESSLLVTINDENNIAHFVANIGGGAVLTAADYKAERIRRREEEKRTRKRKIRQITKGINVAGSKYSPTAAEIEFLLPRSAIKYVHATSCRQARVLQVYTLLSHEMNIYICAVIDKSCDWLIYNSAGCREYESASSWGAEVRVITALKEGSPLGIKLLSKEEIGQTISIAQKHFLIINIGGGKFEVYHKDWQEEREAITRHLEEYYKELQ